MDLRALSGAFGITTIAGTSSLLIGIGDQAASDTTSTFSSLGVFGAALAIAYFMLKRGDRRENDLMDRARQDAQAAQLAVKDALAMVMRLQTEIDEIKRKK
jgi:capsule polysaccharide export protein KpsE/RkpR